MVHSIFRQEYVKMTVKKKPTKKVTPKTKQEIHNHGISNCNIEFTVFNGESIDMVNNLINAVVSNSEANITNANILHEISKTLNCININSAISIANSAELEISNVNMTTLKKHL